MPFDPWLDYLEDQQLKTEQKIKTTERILHSLEWNLAEIKKELKDYQGT